MKTKKLIFAIVGIIIAIISSMMVSCSENKMNSDATGTFEADETIISAEASGVIQKFSVLEGQNVKAQSTVGYIDTIQLSLRKKQVQAQMELVKSKQPNIPIQLATLYEQLSAAEREKARVQKLLSGGAATEKQLDDITSTVDALKKQITAQESNLKITRDALQKEVVTLMVQVEQLTDQIKRSVILNPINGIVLAKYAEPNEMVTTGKPLYKVADLSELYLRAYLSNDQLAKVKLNQGVHVLTDSGDGDMNETSGTVTWISEKAEFTPKTIQTKSERANKVYAVKVRVKNNGSFKIGMYGELKF